ncbi:MAG: long-chain-fatty-acid--CoA ligase [Nitrososphaeria archaeon]|nr:long-chain-fatty-acid--CoA ligase [Nitrososphaeria archaeon]NIN52921.1 long-chain-fatty-acid--CoA ligase [Nitrososphaeria archaeon]NIQ33480.1 long-chain-fatty-acid--CoA ligase [Nitrososphaeria archaeon]
MEEKPWFRFWPEGLPRSLEYPEVPLHDLLRQAVDKHPEASAIVFEGRKMSFRELDELSDRVAAALVDLNVEKGDRVALLLPNVPQFPIGFYGALKAGAVVVPCNSLYRERELRYQLNDSGAETIIALDLLYSTVEKIRSETKLRSAAVTNVRDYLPSAKRIIGPLFKKELRKRTFPDTLNFFDLIKRPPRPPKVEIDPKEDLAVLQYTGGTTGVSKGAMLTHGNLVSNTLMVSNWLPFTERDIHLAVLPFFHIFGLTCAMTAPLSAGNTIIPLPRFTAKKVLEVIQSYRVTLFCGVPTMYVALINHPDTSRYDLTSIRKCVSGAAPLPLAVMNKFNELTNGNLVEGYGLTEASPVTHCNPLDKKEKVRSGSIGIPFPDTDSRIVDLDKSEKEVEPGEAGELAIKGPQVMKGYWKMSEETENVLRGDWLLTGDIAKIDEDGYFYIVDRKKDMIDASGLKVWPREVEDVLYEHPGVREAAVIGVPDPYRGETVKAFVSLKEEYKEKIDKEELINFCREKIASYKAPSLIEFKDELPKTLIGKILRRALREKESQ